MQIELTTQNIITLGAVIGSLMVLWRLLVKLVKKTEEGEKLAKRVSTLEEEHQKDIKELAKKSEGDYLSIKAEQAICIFGILAALKGLHEQGCNGPVTEAIEKIEAHINRRAHEL